MTLIMVDLSQMCDGVLNNKEKYVAHTFPNREGHSNNSICPWNTIQTTYEIREV